MSTTSAFEPHVNNYEIHPKIYIFSISSWSREYIKIKNEQFKNINSPFVLIFEVSKSKLISFNTTENLIFFVNSLWLFNYVLVWMNIIIKNTNINIVEKIVEFQIL